MRLVYIVFFSAIAAVLVLPSLGGAQGEKPVLWAVADRPTSYILHGPDKGRGTVDEVYALLHKGLSDDDHVLVEMNFPRTLEKMRQGECVCSMGFKRPEREEVAYFSEPAVLALSYGVISVRGRLDMFLHGGQLSLEQLLNDKRFKGAVLQQRSYGEITSLISDHTHDGSLMVLPPGSDTQEIVLQGRADYLIEIPSFFMYQAREKGQQEHFVSYVIEEYTTPVLVAYVFCTRNDWGKKFIQQVNAIIRKERDTASYREIIERWYDENSRKLIRDNYDELMGISR